MAGNGPINQNSPRKHADEVKNVLGYAMRVKSGVLAFVALLVGLLAWLVLHLVHNVAQEQQIKLSSFTAFWLEHKPLIVATAVPAVAVAIVGAASRKHHWLWMMLTLLACLVPFAIALYCFVQVVGTMYQYKQI